MPIWRRVPGYHNKNPVTPGLNSFLLLSPNIQNVSMRMVSSQPSLPPTHTHTRIVFLDLATSSTPSPLSASLVGSAATTCQAASSTFIPSSAERSHRFQHCLPIRLVIPFPPSVEPSRAISSHPIYVSTFTCCQLSVSLSTFSYIF